MAEYVDRMLRAARLDIHLYEEVEADKTAMPQAMGGKWYSPVWQRA